MKTFPIADFVRSFPASPLAGAESPWALVTEAPAAVRRLIAGLSVDYERRDEVAIHRSAVVEAGAVLKGPLIIGPRCFVATGVYLRGGCWFDAGCVVGPGVEVKSSFVFAGTRLAHLSFVGDSILGADVNLEAGSVICNHRNERQDDEVRVHLRGERLATGVTKFGALVGDGCRIGANAVLAPGAILPAGTVVGRLALVDQDPR